MRSLAYVAIFLLIVRYSESLHFLRNRNKGQINKPDLSTMDWQGSMGEEQDEQQPTTPDSLGFDSQYWDLDPKDDMERPYETLVGELDEAEKGSLNTDGDFYLSLPDNFGSIEDVLQGSWEGGVEDSDEDQEQTNDNSESTFEKPSFDIEQPDLQSVDVEQPDLQSGDNSSKQTDFDFEEFDLSLPEGFDFEQPDMTQSTDDQEISQPEIEPNYDMDSMNEEDEEVNDQDNSEQETVYEEPQIEEESQESSENESDSGQSGFPSFQGSWDEESSSFSGLTFDSSEFETDEDTENLSEGFDFEQPDMTQSTDQLETSQPEIEPNYDMDYMNEEDQELNDQDNSEQEKEYEEPQIEEEGQEFGENESDSSQTEFPSFQGRLNEDSSSFSGFTFDSSEFETDEDPQITDEANESQDSEEQTQNEDQDRSTQEKEEENTKSGESDEQQQENDYEYQVEQLKKMHFEQGYQEDVEDDMTEVYEIKPSDLESEQPSSGGESSSTSV